MASLTVHPEITHLDSQGFLRQLSSPNQSISKPNKEPSRDRIQVRQRVLETFLGSAKTLQELFQARQIWTATGISAFYTFETEVESLRLTYCFRQTKEISGFLETHKFLVPLLIEAYPEISKHFPDSQVFLEIDTSPEETNNPSLVAFIATNHSPDEALRKLKNFDEEWWLDSLDRAQRKLSINVEFK